jgi:heme/copper-type cytochrome/quinol oxidase subunit 2
MESIVDLYTDIMAILWVIGVVVLFLVAYRRGISFGFKPVSGIKQSITAHRSFLWHAHHTGLETIWTVIPCAILFVIAVPSFTLALALDEDSYPDN